MRPHLSSKNETHLVLTTPTPSALRTILSPEALAFVAALSERFTTRRSDLLAARVKRQAFFDAGGLPDFLPETKAIREGNWKIASIPQNLQDRRVEITGPVERKMVINALNSGAKCFMADFEDSHAPTWEGTLQGQQNMIDAVAGTIAYTSEQGKAYRLNANPAVLIVRPRGWHLDEKHVLLDGAPIPASLFDFGLYFFHNAKTLLTKGSGPYFYLPKLESHHEAALWNDVFVFAQETLGIPQGTIKATVLIETLPASFELHEILHALKDHCVGLNCGRWDYIFSCIKKLKHHPEFLLPDRAQVTMTTHFLQSYSKLVIQTCHQRGAFAMGGMAAFIPIKNDDAANAEVFAKVRADKEREVTNGHDGTWVAHPGLVPLALEVFNQHMPTPNQITKQLTISITAADLLKVPEGTITEAGVRNNVAVALRYLAAWLEGQGCVPIFNLMEDAATAEISRSQLWQWIHHPKAALEDGRKVDASMFEEMLAQELLLMPEAQQAAQLLKTLVLSSNFIEFLTIPAYQQLS
jgi:malate synthase